MLLGWRALNSSQLCYKYKYILSSFDPVVAYQGGWALHCCSALCLTCISGFFHQTQFGEWRKKCLLLSEDFVLIFEQPKLNLSGWTREDITLGWSTSAQSAPHPWWAAGWMSWVSSPTYYGSKLWQIVWKSSWKNGTMTSLHSGSYSVWKSFCLKYYLDVSFPLERYLRT